MGTTNGIARIGSFLSGYVIYLTRFHVLIPYAIFATLAFLASCACLLLPETTGRPTQELITSLTQTSDLELKLSDKRDANPPENKTTV